MRGDDDGDGGWYVHRRGGGFQGFAGADFRFLSRILKSVAGQILVAPHLVPCGADVVGEGHVVTVVVVSA